MELINGDPRSFYILYTNTEKNGLVTTLYNYQIQNGILTIRTYKDLADRIGSQTLQTKVTLKTKGDKMTELTASIMKEK